MLDALYWEFILTKHVVIEHVSARYIHCQELTLSFTLSLTLFFTVYVTLYFTLCFTLH